MNVRPAVDGDLAHSPLGDAVEALLQRSGERRAAEGEGERRLHALPVRDGGHLVLSVDQDGGLLGQIAHATGTNDLDSQRSTIKTDEKT